MTADAAPSSRQGGLRPSDGLLLVVVTAVGLALRMPPVLSHGVPVGDGGLFLQMLDDLRRTFPSLPATTSYNQADIPFVYPPLGFYVAALIGWMTGLPSMDLLRFLPLTFATLCVPALYLLARRLLGSSLHATVAAMAFAVLPRSYDWLIAGGGLTRAPGLLLALLTLVAWLVAFERERRRDWALAGLGLGATVVTHPQAAIFAAVGMAVLLVARGRGAWSASRLAAALAGALVPVAPWLAGLLVIHGGGAIGALLSAGQRWDPVGGLFGLVGFDVAGSPFWVGPVFLGFAGAIACLLRGRYLLPVWVALVFLAGAGGGGFLALPVVALLIAVFVVDVAMPPGSLATAAIRRRVTAVLLAVLLIGVGSSVAAPYSDTTLLRWISPDQRIAMQWVAANTPEDATFVVVEPDVWGTVGEWFPALANRRSANTLQGAEWLGRDAFEHRGAVARDITGCLADGADCLLAALGIDGLDAAIILIPKGSLHAGAPVDCCAAVRQGLAAYSGYVVLYDGPGATVFAPRAPTAGSTAPTSRNVTS